MSRLRSLCRNLLRRGSIDRELDEEVRSAFELLVDEKVKSGLTEADARRAAVIELGRPESITAQVREVRAGSFVEPLLQDGRHGVQLLFRSPLFTAFGVASLALGIGATAAMFALFDAIVLRKLPVREPDRLVLLSFGPPGEDANHWLPYPQFSRIHAHNTTLAGVFAMTPLGRVTLAVRGEPGIAEGMYVSGDYHRTLGLAPAAGRLLGPADDRPGHAVVVLSYGHWQRRFGGRSDIVGTTVTLNTLPFTVVGVEPAGFLGPEVGRPYDLVVPMRTLELFKDDKPPWNEAFATWINVMGRMKTGVALTDVERELRVIFGQVTADAAQNATETRWAREFQLNIESGARGSLSGLRHAYAHWLLLLLLLLGAVLLLASLNLATLLLARSDARQREIATRHALGASRSRIVRQFFTESILLVGVGGVLGMAFASWGSRALLALARPGTERVPVDLSLDHRLIVFTAVICGATSLLFGLIPAIRATSPVRLVLGPQVGRGRQRRLLDQTLVASQVALSLVLLVAAGLFLRTLDRLWAEDTGYDRRNVLMFSVDARLAGKKGPAVLETYRRLIEELRAVPGAQSVTASAVRPVSDNLYLVDSVSQVGEKSLSRERRIPVAFNVIAPGFFATLGIPLLTGRDFDDRDSVGAPRVTIVSERMARHFDGNPVGQRIGSGPSAREVIGVVKDIRHARLKEAPREVLYYPLFQSRAEEGHTPTFEIRYAGTPADVLRSVRDAVSRTDAGLELFHVKTLEAQTADSLTRERLLALLTSYMGGFAVLLACIGLYGLVSYAVTQRTAEIGLRMALGAPPAAVRWLFVRKAAVLVIAGVMVGLLGAFAAVRVVQTQLYGIGPGDPLAFASATALLLVMAFAAAYVPARRASRMDPLTSLRHE